tara:strand:+ start:1215 stop:1391 length:177 start_codon:yes stop_codon:yes gene_type:complete
MDEFKYDHEQDREANYRRWRIMNTDEREEAGQAPHPEDVARRLFNELESSGWLKKKSG